MPEPLACLLTWTCYGTWLHGDERGSVDAEHNARGEPFLGASRERERRSRARMTHAPVRLAAKARQIVRDTIAAHCRLRGWTLHGASVRSNHVHVVVSCPVPAHQAHRELKTWCTRRLREAGVFDACHPVWTEGGSGRYLWTPRSVQRAIEYVSDYQGRDLDS